MIWKASTTRPCMDEAHRLAAHFATQPTVGLGFIKQALDASETNDLDRSSIWNGICKGRRAARPTTWRASRPS